ncbi:stealth family protein [Pediococcus pentosaceus]|uniref:stealth family protein n=1 Tax=Pediococcus pentosaceus TaxID=1255 RepID=UPI0018A17107|nr:stealth family protein [Pediococcus pentosaceus]MBF7140305.1 stealth family protein [Pediococcus pentosaceus]MCM6819406.1 stealth family protein [Pediococcus pentosaceus]
MADKIDFVVTWVDSNDEAWLKKKQQYQVGDKNKVLNTESRYRDFDLLKYWFRSVEKYAPWVNNIFLITDNQIPKWINPNHPRLKLVNHSDYIEKKYLPTFNSNVIELSIGNIAELSENFVLFNDDTFLSDFVTPDYFFKYGTPRDLYAESPIISIRGSVAHAMVNDMEIINESFDKFDFYKKNFTKVFNIKNKSKLLRTIALLPNRTFSGIWNSHLPVSYNKSTFRKVWSNYSKELSRTLENKFRTPYDYNQWVMRYWQLVSGNYNIRDSNSGKVFDLGIADISTIKDEIIKQRHKMICLNDTDNVTDASKIKNVLLEGFTQQFPNKCSYEI